MLLLATVIAATMSANDLEFAKVLPPNAALQLAKRRMDILHDQHKKQLIIHHRTSADRSSLLIANYERLIEKWKKSDDMAIIALVKDWKNEILKEKVNMQLAEEWLRMNDNK